MKLIRRLMGLLLLAFVALAGVVVYRTMAYETPAPSAPMALAAPRAVDAEAAADRLAQAIRIPTISRRDTPVNAAAFTRFNAFLAESYPAAFAALEVETVNDFSLLMTWRGADSSLKPILLLAHSDVVPVQGETEDLWFRPPFSGDIVGDDNEGRVIYGRGAMDDKGSLIAIMEAVELLAASGFQPQRSVILAFGHDEEIGGREGAVAMAKLLADRGVYAWFALDEGGAIFADFPLTGQPTALIGVAEKGYATIRVRAFDEGGHSSMPRRHTAVGMLAQAVTAIEARPMPARLAEPIPSLARGAASDMPWLTRMAFANTWLFGPLVKDQLAQTPAGDAMMRTTTAVTMIEGAPNENVLPVAATAWVNHRIHPEDSLEDVLEHVRTSVRGLERVEVTMLEGASPATAVSDSTGPAFGLIAALADAAAGGAPVAPYLVVGATDARHYEQVADNTYRFLPIVVGEPELAGMHGVNERLSVANLERMVRFYAQLIESGASE